MIWAYTSTAMPAPMVISKSSRFEEAEWVATRPAESHSDGTGVMPISTFKRYASECKERYNPKLATSTKMCEYPHSDYSAKWLPWALALLLQRNLSFSPWYWESYNGADGRCSAPYEAPQMPIQRLCNFLSFMPFSFRNLLSFVMRMPQEQQRVAPRRPQPVNALLLPWHCKVRQEEALIDFFRWLSPQKRRTKI